MKAAWREAEGRSEVLDAIASWQESKVIDGQAEAAARAVFPDDRPRVGRLFRALIFAFVLGAAHALFSATMLSLGETFIHGPEQAGALALLFGVALAAATESLLDKTRNAPIGAAGATAAAACAYLTAGPLLMLAPGDDPLPYIAAWATIVLAAAAARWGMWPFAGMSAVFLFLLLATSTYGRPLQVAVALLIAGAAGRPAPRGEWTRSRRWSEDAILAVAIAALGLALNRYSLDHAWVEWLGGQGRATPPAASLRLLATGATGLFPLALLAWGIRGRRRVVIDLAIAAAVAAAVTLRAYVRIADLWLLLAGGGALLVAISLSMSRWLSRGPEGERGGVTAEPLFSDRRREDLLPIAAAIVASPAGRSPDGGGMEGQGGAFGGGGAQGGF